MMNEIAEKFPVGATFSKSEFCKAVHSLKPDYANSSISWLLKKMQDAGLIALVGRGRYVRLSSRKEKYKFNLHSDEFLQIERMVAQQFPLATFQMWELNQLNEFLNHQIFATTIIVEVEHMLEEFVFNYLKERFSNVLFCPDDEQFYYYHGYEMTIIVQRLISEAPRPIQGHDCTLEKILVDICAKGLMRTLLPQSEYERVFEDSFHKYLINEGALLRYARRRNLEPVVKTYMESHVEYGIYDY